MESKRSYRDAPANDIKLPKEVYHRCMWLVRDAAMLEKLAAAAEADHNSSPDTSYDEIQGSVTVTGEDTLRRAAFETGCIRRALERIPEVYREGLLDNIINKAPFSDFAHPNTWKRWKLVFLYELAKELRLI
jgi:hypothetical protein